MCRSLAQSTHTHNLSSRVQDVRGFSTPCMQEHSKQVRSMQGLGYRCCCRTQARCMVLRKQLPLSHPHQLQDAAIRYIWPSADVRTPVCSQSNGPATPQKHRTSHAAAAEECLPVCCCMHTSAWGAAAAGPALAAAAAWCWGQAVLAAGEASCTALAAACARALFPAACPAHASRAAYWGVSAAWMRWGLCAAISARSMASLSGLRLAVNSATRLLKR